MSERPDISEAHARRLLDGPRPEPYRGGAVSGPPFCWCEPVPCGENPCPTRSLWLDVEDSEFDDPEEMA